MSDKQISFLKEKSISITTLTILVGFIIYQAKFQQRTETSIKDFEKHKSEFIDFKNEVKDTYLPRNEADKDTKNIYDILVEIKDDLNYIKRNK
jgi:hypothetical protein